MWKNRGKRGLSGLVPCSWLVSMSARQYPVPDQHSLSFIFVWVEGSQFCMQGWSDSQELQSNLWSEGF